MSERHRYRTRRESTFKESIAAQSESAPIGDRIAALEESMTTERKDALAKAGDLYRGYCKDLSDKGTDNATVISVATRLIQEANGDIPRSPALHSKAQSLLDKAPYEF